MNEREENEKGEWGRARKRRQEEEQNTRCKLIRNSSKPLRKQRHNLIRCSMKHQALIIQALVIKAPSHYTLCCNESGCELVTPWRLSLYAWMRVPVYCCIILTLDLALNLHLLFPIAHRLVDLIRITLQTTVNGTSLRLCAGRAVQTKGKSRRIRHVNETVTVIHTYGTWYSISPWY